VIDNYDSFTYNLVQLIESLGYECEVFYNDKLSIEDVVRKKPSKIVISPGPGTPQDAGISIEVIRKFYKEIPLLGVCLGHQCIGISFGAELVHARKIMHGKTSRINHEADGLFSGVSSPLTAARYHSLAIDNVKPPLQATAFSDDGTVMAVRHKAFPVYGVQFHPESFLTHDGKKIMRNFLDE
jgi:anthranilate synthase/aminodeoxychorismate synthase-like glutamine amidotransferase